MSNLQSSFIEITQASEEAFISAVSVAIPDTCTERSSLSVNWSISTTGREPGTIDHFSVRCVSPKRGDLPECSQCQLSIQQLFEKKSK